MGVLPGVLFGVVALASIGVGLWLLLSAAGPITLMCARASGECALTNARIVGATTRRFVLTEAQQAIVQESTAGGGRLAYRMAIELASETVPVGGNYSPGIEEKQRAAEEFNAFLGNQQQAEYIYRSAARSISIAGLVVLGFGGILLGVAARQFAGLRRAV